MRGGPVPGGVLPAVAIPGGSPWWACQFPTSYRIRARVLSAVAQAYARRQADGDARRALLEAGRQFVKGQTLVGVDDTDVERILKAAQAAADETLARDLQVLRDRQPRPLVARRVKTATDLSSDEVASDLPKALRAAGQRASPVALGEVAKELAQRLFSLRPLAQGGAEP